jgi:1,4-alpha-glucan branching enzyme
LFFVREQGVTAMKTRLKLSSLCMALGLALCALSHPAYAKTPWNTLSPQQQELLEQVRPKWNSMNTSQQERLLRMSERYSQRDASKQAVMRERIGDWSDLTPQARAEARRNYKALSQEALKRGERNSNWNSYQSLPTQQRLLGANTFDNAINSPKNTLSYPVTPLGNAPALPQRPVAK